MPKSMDISWLVGQARDEETRRRIGEILDQREYILKNNILPAEDETYPMRLGNHSFLFNKSGAYSSIEVYYEIFREGNHFLVPGFTGENAGVVVDIGANEGFYALKLKEISPNCRILCVEPNPSVFEVLKRNIESNSAAGVFLVNKAISGSNGSMPFEFVKGIGAIGSRDLGMIRRPWLKSEFITRTRVESVTLDHLVRDLGFNEVDILKIDVEGMEMDVLESGRDTLKSVRNIVVERHSAELRNRVHSFLVESGFEFLFEEDPAFERYYGDLYFTNRRYSRETGLTK